MATTRKKQNSLKKQAINATSESEEDADLPIENGAVNENIFDTLQSESQIKTMRKRRKSAEKDTSSPRADLPTLDVSIVRALSNACYASSANTSSLYKQLWGEWAAQMHAGFNLLFFGFGSKKQHIEAFVHTFFAHAHIFVFNGYAAPNGGGDLDQFAEMIETHLGNAAAKTLAIVVVHNVEGDLCRTHAEGSMFSTLNQRLQRATRYQTQFRYVFTFDHVSTFATIGDFHGASVDGGASFWPSFISHTIHTFTPYACETALENTLLCKTQTLNVRGIKHVLASVTPNARALFMMLATAQVDERKAGLTLSTLFAKGKEEFLFSNEIAFRTMLTEFLDHKIFVKTRTKGSSDATAAEMLSIPLTRADLEKLVEDLSS